MLLKWASSSLVFLNVESACPFQRAGWFC
jgi:hypothetical protein